MSDPFTLARPILTPIDNDRVKRLGRITAKIELLEQEGRNLQSLLGVGDPTMPADLDLPEFADLHRWSNFSGELFEQYREGAKRQMLEAAQMFSSHIRVRHQIAILVAQLARVRGELRWKSNEVSRWIRRLTLDDLDHDVLTDGAMNYLDQQINQVHDMWIRLMTQVRDVAAAIDWVETVTQNGKPLTEDQARAEHENNLRAIRHLGTDASTGRERVPAGAFGVAAQALSGGHSVAFGRIDRDAGVLRKSLADNIDKLADSGAKFLLLDLPKANQEALNDFLDSERSVADQDTLLDQLRRNGTPSFGFAADSALVELIQAAHRNRLDVVAGGAMLTFEHVPDRRATAVAYLAGMHNSLNGPGIIVTDRINTNVIDGLEQHIPRLVSIDQDAGLLPGEALITPWSESPTAYSDDPELRSDNSTVLFNPLTR